MRKCLYVSVIKVLTPCLLFLTVKQRLHLVIDSTYVHWLFAHIQCKCERYWCDEVNEPLEMADRGFTVIVTGKKVYADYEIRDMTITCVSLQRTT